MKNFKSIKTTKLSKIIKNKYGELELRTTCSHFVATYLEKFSVDVKNDVYVKNGYGAFVQNVGVKIKSVEELKNFFDKKTNKNPYQYILDMLEQGYDLIVGRSFPNDKGYNDENETGIYCRNYLEMIEKENEEIVRL